MFRTGLALLLVASAALAQCDPDWEAGGWVAAQFGFSVATAGDVDGDGFDDVIVGGWTYADTFGGAFVYPGSSAGLATSPATTIVGQQQNSHLGRCVSSAGDVNGDGYDDVVVGAVGDSPVGRAQVHLGSTGGVSSTPAWMVVGDEPGSRFGSSVATAGDVNGDAYDDVLVGEPRYANGRHREGRALLYFGSSNGLSTSPSWVVEGNQSGAEFGTCVAPAGDVNGDGFGDVIVGAPYHESVQEREGSAFLYLGSAGGLASIPVWVEHGEDYWARFGFSVAPAGDVNGDGYGDVIIGAYGFGPWDQGRAYAYLGSASGLSNDAHWTADGDESWENFGSCVATAGDLNADGYSDVIIGAVYQGSDGPIPYGEVSVYLGSAAGLETSPTWHVEEDQGYGRFGNSVAAAGDVDGDGYGDAIIGMPRWWDGDYEGRAFVWHGPLCPELGIDYCTATPNSTGAPADISAFGSDSSAAGELDLVATPVPDQVGIFFHGRDQVQLSFGNGYLCASNDVVRGAVIQATNTRASYRYDNSDARHSVHPYVGSTRHFQYWFRDSAGGGALFNTSNAISIAILP